MASSGDTLASYRLVTSLSQRQRSEVWKAVDGDGRTVALRILRNTDAAHVTRLAQEAAILGELAHPNIAPVIDTGRDGENTFVVTEFVEGTGIDGQGALDAARFFDLAVPLASAISAANKRHVIHGHLTPRSVVINSDGVVQVLDFCARSMHGDESPVGVLPEDAPTETLTHETEVDPVVLPFCSPERVQGKPLDVRADTYSLGAILYSMATGCPPFTAETSADLIVAVVRDLPPPISGINTLLPAELDRIIGRTLVKDRTKRLQESRFLLEDLERLSGHL